MRTSVKGKVKNETPMPFLIYIRISLLHIKTSALHTYPNSRAANVKRDPAFFRTQLKG
jgi:hypothetical protein